MEETLRYIHAYNRYIQACEDEGVVITVTYPMFKKYCKMVEEMV